MSSKGGGASSGSGSCTQWLQSVNAASWLDRTSTFTLDSLRTKEEMKLYFYFVFSRRGSDWLHDRLSTSLSQPLLTPTLRWQSVLAARVTLCFFRRLISRRGRPPPPQLCDWGLAVDDGDICPIIPQGGTPAAHFQFISMSLPATANWIKQLWPWEAQWSRSFYCRPKGLEDQKNKTLKAFGRWFVYLHIKWEADTTILCILRDFYFFQ